MSTNSEIPDEGQIDEMVQSLADWLSKQAHLPQIQNDKQILRKFLVNCKYRVQKAKTKVDRFYSARSAHPSVYGNRDPSTDAMQKISTLCPLFTLPKRTKTGEIILVAKAEPNIAEIIPADYVKYLAMVLDIIFHEEEKLDFIVIIDYRGYSFQHFLKMTTIATMLAELTIEIFPGQFKGVHYVYVPSFIDSVVALCKKLLKPKLRDRIHVHKDLDTFHDIVGRDLLPSDLGGKELSIEELNDLYRKKVESYKGWFESQENVRSKEELRPAAAKDSLLMGVEGSFRRLAVD